MIYVLLIMLCKFVNKTYIISHDMRKDMVSERGGGADKKKRTKKKKKKKKKPITITYYTLNCIISWPTISLHA